jgi:hypothetical protein
MTWMTRRLSVLTLTAVLLGGGTVGAADDPKPAKDVLSFGSLQSPTPAAARQRAPRARRATVRRRAAFPAATRPPTAPCRPARTPATPISANWSG